MQNRLYTSIEPGLASKRISFVFALLMMPSELRVALGTWNGPEKVRWKQASLSQFHVLLLLYNKYCAALSQLLRKFDVQGCENPTIQPLGRVATTVPRCGPSYQAGSRSD